MAYQAVRCRCLASVSCSLSGNKLPTAAQIWRSRAGRQTFTTRALRKGELANLVAEKLAINPQVSAKVVDTLFEVIVEAVASGDKVAVTGFGSWEARERAARMGRNPKTGEPLPLEATKVVSFSAGKRFKDVVKSGNSNGVSAEVE